MSLVESVANVIVGFVLAMITQATAFPLFGIAVSASDNVVIAMIFTVVSLVRSYTLRRIFESIRAGHSRG